MKTLVPALVGQARVPMLRSIEAEREFRKNAIGAFAIAVAIHATVIASYFLFPANVAIKINPTIRGGTIVPVFPIDLNYGWKPKPPGSASAKAGIPIPVPIVEAENEHEFASQENTASNGVVGEYGTGEGSDGDVVGNPGEGIISIEEDTPTECWTVEREPVRLWLLGSQCGSAFGLRSVGRLRSNGECCLALRFGAVLTACGSECGCSCHDVERVLRRSRMLGRCRLSAAP